MIKIFVSRLSILFGFSCLLSVIFLEMNFFLMLFIVGLGLTALLVAGRRVREEENNIEEMEKADIAAARVKLDSLHSSKPEEQSLAQVLQFRPRSARRFNS